MARPIKRNTGIDSGFENYRRERNRRRLDSGTPKRDLGDKSQVLQELEAAEAREVRNQQLTREVREFFEDATRTAATIVQKVADEQEEHAEERLARQMSDFLQDAVHRAQGYIQILQLSNGKEAHKEVSANMQNLVGPMLDSFRSEGTAQLHDKHLGQDPFDSDVLVPEPVDAGDGDLLVEVDLDDGEEEGFVSVEEIDDVEDEVPVEEAPVDVAAEPEEEPEAMAAEDAPSPQAVAEPQHRAAAGMLEDDLFDREVAGAFGEWVRGLEVDTLKGTLKLLVQRGVMTKDTARELYRLEMTARAHAGEIA